MPTDQKPLSLNDLEQRLLDSLEEAPSQRVQIYAALVEVHKVRELIRLRGPINAIASNT